MLIFFILLQSFFSKAHGTSLLAVTACGAGGAVSFFSSGGQVDVLAAVVIASTGMLTAGLGLTSHSLPLACN